MSNVEPIRRTRPSWVKPRDRSRTPAAKTATVARKRQRALKRSRA